MKRPCVKRLAVGIAAPALLILGLVWFWRGGHLLCPFYELTGLYCPGCGSGRAARALLRGDLGACLGHNLLALPLGLFCGGVLGWEYLRFVFPGLCGYCHAVLQIGVGYGLFFAVISDV